MQELKSKAILLNEAEERKYNELQTKYFVFFIYYLFIYFIYLFILFIYSFYLHKRFEALKTEAKEEVKKLTEEIKKTPQLPSGIVVSPSSLHPLTLMTSSLAYIPLTPLIYSSLLLGPVAFDLHPRSNIRQISYGEIIWNIQHFVLFLSSFSMIYCWQYILDCDRVLDMAWLVFPSASTR